MRPVLIVRAFATVCMLAALGLLVFGLSRFAIASHANAVKHRSDVYWRLVELGEIDPASAVSSLGVETGLSQELTLAYELSRQHHEYQRRNNRSAGWHAVGGACLLGVSSVLLLVRPGRRS